MLRTADLAVICARRGLPGAGQNSLCHLRCQAECSDDGAVASRGQSWVLQYVCCSFSLRGLSSCTALMAIADMPGWLLDLLACEPTCMYLNLRQATCLSSAACPHHPFTAYGPVRYTMWSACTGLLASSAQQKGVQAVPATCCSGKLSCKNPGLYLKPKESSKQLRCTAAGRHLKLWKQLHAWQFRGSNKQHRSKGSRSMAHSPHRRSP